MTTGTTVDPRGILSNLLPSQPATDAWFHHFAGSIGSPLALCTVALRTVALRTPVVPTLLQSTGAFDIALEPPGLAPL